MRDRREVLRDGGHGGVVGEVGDAGLSDLGLPAAEELLEDDIFDSHFVELGANVLDNIVDDRSVDGGLRANGGERSQLVARGVPPPILRSL